MNTPWGIADNIEGRGEGVAFVSTPGHGGFKVNASENRRIPRAWQKASFNLQGLQGWYEEDCDWCMVALTFPQYFSEDELKAAQSTFDHWIKPKLS